MSPELYQSICESSHTKLCEHSLAMNDIWSAGVYPYGDGIDSIGRLMITLPKEFEKDFKSTGGKEKLEDEFIDTVIDLCLTKNEQIRPSAEQLYIQIDEYLNV
jgi:hypothetical protein